MVYCTYPRYKHTYEYLHSRPVTTQQTCCVLLRQLPRSCVVFHFAGQAVLLVELGSLDGTLWDHHDCTGIRRSSSSSTHRGACIKLLTVDYEYDYPRSERASGRDAGVIAEAVLSSFVTSLAVEVQRNTPGAPFQCLASRESPHSHSNAARQNLCQERWAEPRLQSSLSRVLVVRCDDHLLINLPLRLFLQQPRRGKEEGEGLC